MSKTISERDNDADGAIAAMVTAVVASAVTPAAVNWSLTAAAMGTGCVAIGKIYGITLTHDEAWKLIKQFLLGAGTWFLAMNLGSKFVAFLLQATGLGYGAGVLLDVSISAAVAYAVGACAKDYFRRDLLGKTKPTKKELSKIFKDAFNKKKNDK